MSDSSPCRVGLSSVFFSEKATQTLKVLQPSTIAIASVPFMNFLLQSINLKVQPKYDRRPSVWVQIPHNLNIKLSQCQSVTRA